MRYKHHANRLAPQGWYDNGYIFSISTQDSGQKITSATDGWPGYFKITDGDRLERWLLEAVLEDASEVHQCTGR